MTAYQIEPELLRGTPRVLKRRGSGAFMNGCGVVLSAPLTTIGLIVFLCLLYSTVSLPFHPLLPAQVTSRKTLKRDGDLTYYLAYKYRYGNVWLHNKRAVSLQDYQTTQVGSRVHAKRLPPFHDEQLVMPNGNAYPSFSTLYGPRWYLTIVLNICFATFLWASWILPRRRKALVELGIPVEGRIYGKTEGHARGSGPKIHYQYSVHETPGLSSTTQQPETHFGYMEVSNSEYNAAVKGDAVTVLYDVKNPKSSLMYRYADYEVVA